MRTCHLLLSLFLAPSAFAGFDEGMEALEREEFGTAVVEFRKAARQGDLESAHQLGMMYLEGRGVARDPARAIELLEEASEAWMVRDRHKLGFMDAQYLLGTVYRDGNGVPRNSQEAEGLFRQASEQGHPQAQHALAELYLRDSGEGTDYSEAYFWLSLARGSLTGEEAQQVEDQLKAIRHKLSRDEIRRVEHQVSSWSPREW